MIAEPRALWLLTLVVPMAWFSYRRYRRSAKGIVAVVGGAARDTASLYMVRWFFGILTYLLAFVFGVLALSGVLLGRTAPAEKPTQSETLFLFDISRSMLATDVKPSRLELSTAVARKIIDDHEGSSFGIVVFKGRGSVFLPITSDYSALVSHLGAVDPGIITYPGTNLEAGLATALSTFPGVRDVRKNIVLFTDGDVLEGDPDNIADKIGRQEIDLILVAAGRTDPVEVVLDGEALVDNEGNTVRTALRLDVLESIRDESEGILLSLDDGDVVSAIGSYVGGSRRIERGAHRDRYRLFTGWALVFLLIWVGLRTIRWGTAF